LNYLGSIEIGQDVFTIAFFLGVCLACSVHFEEFLDTIVAGLDDGPAFLDNSIFGLDFFEEMLNLGW